jgi:peptidoglycan/LPS O-acetylase OafA/YrhL
MSAAGRPAEIKALSGARALPPLLLVLYHYHEGHGYQHFRLFDVFIAKGYLWVEFFFALSGFVLILSHGGQRMDWSGYVQFLKARLARLYPLHLATLLIMLAMIIVLNALAAWGGYASIYNAQGYHPYATWPSFIGNLFLVQAWHLFPSLSWNGVAWFVSVLFFIMLIFPVFLRLARGGVVVALLMIAAALGTLWGLIVTSGHGLDITFDFGIVRGLADFTVGVALAMLYRAIQTRAAAAPEWQHTVAQAIVGGLFLYAIYNTGWSHTARDYWVVPPLLALILAMAFDKGLLARAVGSKPLLRLGEWSFAIYLGQTTWLQFLRFAEARLYPGIANMPTTHIVEPIVLVIVCALWGGLLYVAVERPAAKALRPFLAQQNKRGTAAA